jgi:anti-sigma-K factor RskA
MNTDHIDIETLSAYADGELKAPALTRVEQHLATCSPCAAALARLRAAVAAAGALPRGMEPPPEVWGAIRSRLADARSAPNRPVRWWHNGWLAAAAAVMLVVATALLVPRGAGRAKGAKVGVPQTPVVLASVEKNYAPTITELRETLNSQRAVLSPNTVKTLDRSLAVIDSAIAEASAALVADPASAALADMLAAYYERKVGFLKRATNLSSSM